MIETLFSGETDAEAASAEAEQEQARTDRRSLIAF